MSDRKTRIKELIIERMNLRLSPSDIGDDQGIFGNEEGSLALDSIDALDLVVAIYEEFDVEIQDSDMHIFASVQSIDDFVGSRIAEKVPA